METLCEPFFGYASIILSPIDCHFKVKILNDQWPDGMLNHMDLQKIEKKFKVKGNDVENAINEFL